MKIRNNLKQVGIKNKKDLVCLMDSLLKKNKVMSRQSIAREMISKYSKNWTNDQEEESIREINQQIVQTKDYLEKNYGIKNTTLKEAIKQVYPVGEVEIFFTRVNSHANWYIADANLFYKDEINLQKYVKLHTKCKPITAVFCDL